jgi:hypothetical protein
MHPAHTGGALAAFGTAVILFAAASPGLAGPAEAPACTGGRFQVSGPALVPGGPQGQPDEVVIQTPGPAEGAPPTALVASGCPETPAELTGSRTVTRLDVAFPGCGAVAGPVRLRGTIDPSCRTLTGTFTGPSAPRRAFTATRVGDYDPRVAGTVSAVHGDASLLLPGATVFLRDPATMIRVPGGVMTDAHGDFRFPPQPPGTYEVCAEAPGFVTACDPGPADLSPASPAHKYRALVLRPAGGAIHGRVLLGDGSPCFHDRPGFGPQVAATVTLGSRTVMANSKGEYVLPDIPGTGTYPVDAACAAAQAHANIGVDTPQLSGAVAVDVSIRNRPPVITLLGAANATGPLRTASPGETVQVTVQTADPDGDPLHYQWRDGNDLLSPMDAPTIAWPLLGVPAANTISLEVTDGKGGFAERQLVLGTSPTGARFIGTVTDGATGAALAGAQVDVDGITATTDDAGWFRIATPESERHVLTVRHPGYALLSQVYHGNATGLALRLMPAQRTTVDPTQDIELTDGRKGATVHIPANSLVDALGQLPSGPVTIDLATYNPMLGAVPGDREVLDASKQPLTLHHTQGMSLDITDAAGRRYNLASGHKAIVGFQAPAQASPPETLRLSHYDEASGTWHEMGQAVRRGARYLAVVSSFSSWNVGHYSSDTACLRIDVDDNQLQRPFHLRILLGIIGPQELVGEFTVTDQTTLVYGLPPNTWTELAVSPQNETDQILQVRFANTGAGGFKSPPPFPYSGCGQVTLKAYLPTNTWLNRFSFGTDQGAEDYYASIGARPDKDTFKKWRAANGFVAGDSVSDVAFFNPNELGLGRRANCKQTGGNGLPIYVACYVTKFGHVGGSPAEMLDDTIDEYNPGDTVAMEFSPGPNTNGQRITKFYIYGPDGNLKTHTAFDPEGDVKHVPNVCLHCHGGGNPAQFVTLDPHAYQYPPSGPYTLANQQERFREMNSMIAYTFHHTGPGWDFMDSLYPQAGVHTAGAKAFPAPLPAAWAGHDELYFDIIKPSCRTCHMHLGNIYDFSKFDVGLVMSGHQRVCQGQMPNAISPMLRLWRSNDPHLPDVMANSVGLPGCNSTNALPDVQIVTPTNGSNVAFGGLGLTHFTATVSDAEDGPNCCSVKWTSDEGVMGYGRELDYGFASPGAHTVTVRATDSNGAWRETTVTLQSDNTPPAMTILKPTVGQVLYRNVAYPFLGSSWDPNEPYLAVPCKSMIWTSSKPGDPTGAGCQPQLTFTTLGQRTITLSGMDSDGGVGSATRTFTVIDPPANSPPTVVINTPGDGDSLDRNVPVVLSGTAIDPDGQVTPTVSWTMQVGGGPETTLGNTQVIGWVPQNYLAQSCTPVDVVLRLYGTDPDGTSVDAITVSVYYPPC